MSTQLANLGKKEKQKNKENLTRILVSSHQIGWEYFNPKT
jgi:hypothetical protein